ncbi:hypothetical protein D3C84_985980 [compost metagenome]
MNLALYDISRNDLSRLPSIPGMTPKRLRQFSLTVQVAAIAAEGETIHGILVGWQDAPSDYIGVFMLGDYANHPLPPTVLDRIERLARGQ